MDKYASISSKSGILREKKSGEIIRQSIKDSALNPNGENWIAKALYAVVIISLMAIFFGVPIFFTGFSSQSIGFEKQIYFYFWILVALIAWVSNGVVRGEMKIRRTPLDIPIIIFWFACLLSSIFSVDKWHSFWGFFGDPTHGFINITASIVVYYIILSHFSERIMRFLLGSFLTSGFIAIIYEFLILTGILKLQNQSFIQANSWAQFLPTNPIGSVSGTTVYLSVLCILFITVFLKLKLSEGAKWKKNILKSIFLIIVLISLYALFAFYSFVPWPAILIGVGFLLIYVLARIVKTSSGSTWLPMIVFLAVLSIFLIGGVESVFKFNIVPVNIPAEINISYKLSWQVAKEAMKDNFFLGSGPATYGYIFSLYHPQEFNLSSLNNISLHNLRFYQGSGILWEIMPTLGALGTFSFILLIISFLSVTIYFLSKDKERNKIYSLGAMASMIVIIVSSFMIRMEGALVILSVLLGSITLGINLLESDAKEDYINLSLKASPKYALALAFVFLVVSASVIFFFVFLGKMYIADIFAGISGRQKNITEEGSISSISKAIKLYDKEGRYYTIAGQQYMALANKEILKGDNANIELTRQYLENSIAFALKGKELMPKDVLAVEVLAQAYENKASYLVQLLDQAIAIYGDALALEPHNPDIYLKIGQLNAKKASVEEDKNKNKELMDKAIDMFQKSISEKNDYAPGYYYLSLINNQAGDIDKAIEFAENARKIDLQNADYVFNLANLYREKGGDDNLKTSEYLYQQILQVAPNNANTLLGLGLLYEKQGKNDQAVEQYEKVLDALSPESTQARTQVQTLIDNIKNGVSNEVANSVDNTVEEETQNITENNTVDETENSEEIPVLDNN
ncbi:MAG TPA: tetratricopeptide repeat protein [Candidatus Moranbacteria bacterium]|nr:tetratricopeptide repeat protein [Candidatus Moranbacteria bacterium]HRZ34157.1 tetratricopeptide repeat protein [Candidatus Moranbacteria bacterium]